MTLITIAGQLQTILQLYVDCSGQVINKAKSAILFSRNTNLQQKKVVCDLLQVTKETMSEKVFGIAGSCGQIQSRHFCIPKVPDMEMNARLEREISAVGW